MRDLEYKEWVPHRRMRNRHQFYVGLWRGNDQGLHRNSNVTLAITRAQIVSCLYRDVWYF